MVNEREISDLFDRLGLRSEKERQKVLSQGVVLPQEGAKKVLWIDADSITNPYERNESNARLE
jgi:hypothetical protein